MKGTLKRKPKFWLWRAIIFFVMFVIGALVVLLL